MKTYDYAIYDRDGGEVTISEEDYPTEAEADEAAKFHEDDPRYGSHEVFANE